MKTKYGRKWTNISVDLHSCGLSPETWKEIEVINPPFSFNTNFHPLILIEYRILILMYFYHSLP